MYPRTAPSRRRPFADLRLVSAALLLMIAMLALVPAIGSLTGVIDGDAGVVAAGRDRDVKGKGSAKDNGAGKGNGKTRERTGQVATKQAGEGSCGPGLEALNVNGATMCTHGGDTPPAGYDRMLKVAPLGPMTRSAQSVSCIGDGNSGPRFEVLYLYDVAKGSKYDTYLPSFRTWIADMNTIFDESAKQTGGRRQLRLVTDSSCRPVVTPVGVTAKDLASFGGSIEAVIKQGFSKPERNYLMFADATVFCGVGTVRPDTKPTLNNANNMGGSYSRADSGCWSGFVIAHEVMHNLGGIQLNAPNSSGGWHCTDENDVMCYSDAPHYPAVKNACTTGAWEKGNFFDCNKDDYFNTNPDICNYLANNWNTANSSFLHNPSGSQPPAPATGQPCVKLGVSTVAIGESVSVSAEGFTPGAGVAVSIGGRPVGAMTANAAGSARGTVTIPLMAGGSQQVIASDGAMQASTTVTLTASLTVAPGTLTLGKPVRIRMQGFSAGETVDVWLGNKKLRTVAVSANGTANVSVKAPAKRPPGPPKVQAVGRSGGMAAKDVTVKASSPKR
jgi:hypothetical protein